MMLTLNRGRAGGLDVSEIDAKKAGLVDNDWVEVFNTNGALTARAVVSPAHQGRHAVHVSRAGKDREHPRQPDHRQRAAAFTTRSPAPC
ncbi:MAG: molybdopterin dinucleotide binding domain-containing protein [Cypionkella sp.]